MHFLLLALTTNTAFTTDTIAELRALHRTNGALFLANEICFTFTEISAQFLYLGVKSLMTKFCDELRQCYPQQNTVSCPTDPTLPIKLTPPTLVFHSRSLKENSSHLTWDFKRR